MPPAARGSPASAGERRVPPGSARRAARASTGAADRDILSRARLHAAVARRAPLQTSRARGRPARAERGVTVFRRSRPLRIRPPHHGLAGDVLLGPLHEPTPATPSRPADGRGPLDDRLRPVAAERPLLERRRVPDGGGRLHVLPPEPLRGVRRARHLRRGGLVRGWPVRHPVRGRRQVPGGAHVRRGRLRAEVSVIWGCSCGTPLPPRPAEGADA